MHKQITMGNSGGSYRRLPIAVCGIDGFTTFNHARRAARPAVMVRGEGRFAPVSHQAFFGNAISATPVHMVVPFWLFIMCLTWTR